jgi:outer membrane lipoprotein-sorting protein
VDVQNARLDGLSGTVVQKSELGLPTLPGASSSGGTASSDLTSMISGTHTMRVWFAGPDKARMALMGTSGESDVISNGKDVWVWASKPKTAQHYVLPQHDATKDATKGAAKSKAAAGMPDSAKVPTSPQAAADKALAAISPSTRVTTSGTATVASRAAYELVLTPRESTSMVAQVRIAIDGKEHVPLRVQVFAKKVADPVFEVAFSAVDFARPDAAQFTFTPPPGTKVTESKLTPSKMAAGKMTAGKVTAGKAPTKAEIAKAKAKIGAYSRLKVAGSATGSATAAADEPKVIGKGWGSVLVTKVPAIPAAGAKADPRADQTLTQLTKFVKMLPKVSGSWGSGHLMSGTVFSALLTDDGRLVVGAVTPEGLYAALAAK